MFYAKFNLFGSDSCVGFPNTWQVASFESRAARDAWVNQDPCRLDVAPITQREALKMASPLHRRHYLEGMGHLANIHFLTDDNAEFRRAW